MGKIHYDPTDPNACKEFPDQMFNITTDVSPFVLGMRGECSFVQKVRNMENAGVAVAIVVDNKNEFVDEILMSDDGTGGGIRIPSMLIGKKDGTKIIEWMAEATQEEKDQIVIMCEFIMAENAVVTYDFWFTSSSDRALNFLEDFASMGKKLDKYAQFTPHYVFWECMQCDQKYLENDCYGGGKYCAVEPSNANIKGHEIVLEDLRQLCLWEHLSEKNTTEQWWQYIHEVHRSCNSVINHACSKNAHERLGINFDDTQSCVQQSFTGSDWQSKTNYNEKIDKEIQYWREYGTAIYPSIVINQKTYRGQIEPLSVYNALCAGFTDPPEQCLKTLHKEKLAVVEDEDFMNAINFDTKYIIALVVALILLNVVIVYCCRRKAKRDMQNEMNMQIESAVSQYFALTTKEPDGSQRSGYKA